MSLPKSRLKLPKKILYVKITERQPFKFSFKSVMAQELLLLDLNLVGIHTVKHIFVSYSYNDIISCQFFKQLVKNDSTKTTAKALRVIGHL